MKGLVDTCGWIEWLTSGQLADQFSTYLKKPERLVIPTIVQYELYKWIYRERDEATALEVIGITELGQVVPLNSNLALYAADLGRQHKLATADAIVYATALSTEAQLITCDQHFQNLPEVIHFPKN